MIDNNFDYNAFSEETIKRISSSLPEDISSENKSFICDIIKQFINKTGELLKKESFTIEQQQKFCQVVADWTLYTSVDMIRGNTPNKYWEPVLKSIATLAYEIMKEGYSKNINEGEIMVEVKDYIYKLFNDKLAKLYAKADKEEDHTDCYSLGDKEKEELLNDNAAMDFAQNLAYRYLLKAAHCLKKVSMQTNDRQKVLLLLRNATSKVINNSQTTNFNFSIPQIERVITVSMELLFHRIVMLYKNNILSNNDWSTECVNYFATSIYFDELKFIKNNWALEGTYQYTETNSNNDFREYFDTYVKSNFLTQEQVNNAFKKSYIVYLEKEIQRLILADKNIDTVDRNE